MHTFLAHWWIHEPGAVFQRTVKWCKGRWAIDMQKGSHHLNADCRNRGRVWPLWNNIIGWKSPQQLFHAAFNSTGIMIKGNNQNACEHNKESNRMGYWSPTGKDWALTGDWLNESNIFLMTPNSSATLSRWITSVFLARFQYVSWVSVCECICLCVYVWFVL